MRAVSVVVSGVAGVISASAGLFTRNQVAQRLGWTGVGLSVVAAAAVNSPVGGYLATASSIISAASVAAQSSPRISAAFGRTANLLMSSLPRIPSAQELRDIQSFFIPDSVFQS